MFQSNRANKFSDNKFITVLFSIFRIILVILLTASILVTMLSLILKTIVLNENNYNSGFITESFISGTMEYIEKDIQNEVIQYDIPYYAVQNKLFESDIRRIALSYGDSITYSLFNKAEFQDYSEDAFEIYYRAVKEYFDGANTAIDEETIVEISTAISNVVCNDIGSFKIQAAINIISENIFTNKYINALCNGAYWLLTLTIILTALSLLLCAKSFNARVYYTSGAFWISSNIILIPTLILKFYNWQDKFVIDDSPMKLFFTSLVNTLISNTTLLVSIISFTATLLLVLAIIYRVKIINAEANK